MDINLYAKVYINYLKCSYFTYKFDYPKQLLKTKNRLKISI